MIHLITSFLERRVSYHIGSTNNFDVFYYFYDIFSLNYFFFLTGRSSTLNSCQIQYFCVSYMWLSCVLYMLLTQKRKIKIYKKGKKHNINNT